MSNGEFAKQALFDLLPSVIRQRDSSAGDTLRDPFLKALGEQIDALQTEIAKANANSFVETCDRNALPYIADLVGYRPIAALDPKYAGKALDDKANDNRTAASQMLESDQAQPAFRRDVARTVWARRRKGTIGGLEGVARAIAGWHTVIFENGRCVVSTPALRYPGVLTSQGTPDLRKLVGPARVDQGPGLIPRLPTVQRVDADPGRGRWHPLDVVVKTWNLQGCLQDQNRRNAEACSVNGHLAFDPLGREIALYAPADSHAEVTEILESARALRVSDFVGSQGAIFKNLIYGSDRAICLFIRKDSQLDPIDGSRVRFGRLDHQHDRTAWIIDPERGLFKPPASTQGEKVICRYCCLHAGHSERDSTLIKHVMKVRTREHVPMEARSSIEFQQ